MPSPKKPSASAKARKRRTIRVRKGSTKKGTTTRSRVPSARGQPIPDLILDPQAIIDASDDLVLSFPNLSDQMRQFAHLVVQTGYPFSRIALTMGWSKSWVYSTACRPDWCDYLNAVSMRALGWARAQAHGSMTQLLNHNSAHIRLAAASELMERGGHRLDPPKSAALNVQFNVSINGSAEGEPSVTIEGERVDGTRALPPQAEAPSKTGPALGGGSPTHAGSGYDQLRPLEAAVADVSTRGSVKVGDEDEADW